MSRVINGIPWTNEEVLLMSNLINFIFACMTAKGGGKIVTPSSLSPQQLGQVFGKAYDLFSTVHERSWKAFRRSIDRHYLYKTGWDPKPILTVPVHALSAEFNSVEMLLLTGKETTKSTPIVAPVPAKPTRITDVARKIQVSAPVKNVWEKIADIQEPYKVPFKTVNDTTNLMPVKKILTLSDIHMPFARLDLLKQAVEDNLDANVVVLNGDIIEAYAFSSYSKSKSVQAIDEYKIAFEFVKYLSETFEQVYLVDGNHEGRVGRALRRTDLPKETHKFYGTSLMARIANGEMLKSDGTLDYQVRFKNVFYDPSSSWYVKIGKTIFAHPHARSTGQVGSTVKRTGDYFSSMYGVDDLDCVVIGHTHKQSKMSLAHLLLIEQGAFSAPANYAHGPDLTYFGGTQNGYAIVWQDANGNCIRNMTDFYTFGTAIPDKK
jgi:predicted phosphodiesterase